MGRHASRWSRTHLNQGDIYVVSLDPTFGHEQQGTRPVLVISTNAFNKRMRMPIMVPISNGANFARVAGFTVPLTGCGTNTTGVVRCDQPRSLDLLARNARRVEDVPSYVLDEVIDKVQSIFE
jgi:mRNA interferase ChpB